MIQQMNLRQKIAAGAAIFFGAVEVYLVIKGQKPPAALDQAFIAALGVLAAPKQKGLPHEA